MIAQSRREPRVDKSTWKHKHRRIREEMGRIFRECVNKKLENHVLTVCRQHTVSLAATVERSMPVSELRLKKRIWMADKDSKRKIIQISSITEPDLFTWLIWLTAVCRTENSQPQPPAAASCPAACYRFDSTCSNMLLTGTEMFWALHIVLIMWTWRAKTKWMKGF